jgi:hypothetical protein
MDDYLEEDDYREEEIRPWADKELLCLPFPLDHIDIWAARFEVARRIRELPFSPDEEATRSLWIAFAGEWGVWVRACVPVDDRLDAGDPVAITATCALVADLLVEPDCYDYPVAVVILRRLGPPSPSRADRSILRKLDKAAATRNAVPWSFFIATPEDLRPLRVG